MSTKIEQQENYAWAQKVLQTSPETRMQKVKSELRMMYMITVLLFSITFLLTLFLWKRPPYPKKVQKNTRGSVPLLKAPPADEEDSEEEDDDDE